MVQMGWINKTKADLITLQRHCRSHETAGLCKVLFCDCRLRSTKITAAHVFSWTIYLCLIRVNSSENVSACAVMASKWLLWWFLSKLLGGQKHKGHLEERIKPNQQEANSKVNTFCYINIRSLTTQKANFKVRKIHIFFFFFPKWVFHESAFLE